MPFLRWGSHSIVGEGFRGANSLQAEAIEGGQCRVDFSSYPVELPWWDFRMFCVSANAISASPGMGCARYD